MLVFAQRQNKLTSSWVSARNPSFRLILVEGIGLTLLGNDSESPQGQEMSHRPQPKRIGSKLLAIRQRLGLSQSQMFRLLELKCCYTRISEFETGRRQPNLLTLLAYARAAKVPLEQIVDDVLELEF
jgi:DNA-binding XRE family transcriptional regulator